MNWHRRLARSVLEAIELSHRARVLSILRDMDPQFLTAMGISLELLDEGITGWPWRSEDANGPSSEHADEKACAAQPQNCETTGAEQDNYATGSHRTSEVGPESGPQIDDIAA